MTKPVDWTNDDVVFESEESYLASFLAFWQAGKKIQQEGGVFDLPAPIPVAPVVPVVRSVASKVCCKCSKGSGSRDLIFYHGKPWCRDCKDKFFYSFNRQRHESLDKYMIEMGIKKDEEE